MTIEANLQKRIAGMALRDAERKGKKPAPNPPLATRGSLPTWPEGVRGVPNVILRSALFGALRRGPRGYVKTERMASVEGIEIFYTGQRLDQGDLDVWEILVHVARHLDLGNALRVTAYDLLMLLGQRDTGGRKGSRGTLDARITRMNASAVRVRLAGRYSYEGSLLEHVCRDEETRHYVIALNQKLLTLFGQSEYTLVDWTIRRALDGKPLAQWLHRFYSSHANPYPIAVATLHKLCGSEAKQLFHFRLELRKALNAVADAYSANHQSFHAEIIADLVHIQRTPSPAQRKHLAKKPTTTG